MNSQWRSKFKHVLRRLLFPKDFGDDKTMAFSVLNIITLIECFRPIFLLLMVWLNPSMGPRIFYVIINVLVLSIGCNILNRMGYTKFAGILFIVHYNLSLFVSAWTGGGVYSSAISALIVVTFWAGFILPAPYAAFIAIINMLSGIVFAWAGQQGLLPTPMFEHTAASFWANNMHNIFLMFITQQTVNLLLARNRRSQREAIRKEQESKETLLAMSKVKDDFLTNLSHELRTPLTSIIGWSELLKDNSLDETTKDLAIDTILRNATQQTHLVDDLLDLSRISRDGIELDLQSIPVLELVREVLGIMLPAAGHKSITFSVDNSGGNTLSVWADRKRTRQVLWNLLANAVKFSPIGGTVLIRIQKRDSQVRIMIIDQGIGITADYLPHIFERFSQEDQSRSRPFGGLGIGLSISKHYVDMMGGSLIAESPGRDAGATFILELPQPQDSVDNSGVFK